MMCSMFTNTSSVFFFNDTDTNLTMFSIASDNNMSPPDDLMEPLNTARLIVTFVVGIPGLLMNVVNIIVWTTPIMRRTPSSLYMYVIAASDLLYLVTSIVYSVNYIIEFYIHQDRNVNAHIVLNRLFSLATAFSTYTTMCLSIDRAIAVTKPLKWRSICSKGRVKGVVVASFMFSLALQIPDVIVAIDGVTHVQYTSLYPWWDVYSAYVVPVFFSFLPTFVVIVTNAVIFTKIAGKSEEVRNTSTKRKSQKEKITFQVCLISLFTFLQHSMYITQMIMFQVRRASNTGS